MHKDPWTRQEEDRGRVYHPASALLLLRDHICRHRNIHGKVTRGAVGGSLMGPTDKEKRLVLERRSETAGLAVSCTTSCLLFSKVGHPGPAERLTRKTVRCNY